MTVIDFLAMGEPTGKGRPKVVRRPNLPYPVAITPDKTVRAEQSLLSQALPHKPAEPLTGPLSVTIIAYCRIPSSWSKKKVAEAVDNAVYPTGKPDADNLAKLVLDALNGVFYLDDKQVVDLFVRKRYMPIPGLHIQISDEIQTLSGGGGLR